LPIAIEQGAAKCVFQRADPFGQSRLCDVELLGCLAEMAMIRDSDESSKPFNIHSC
jgi:hypothetical protein